MIGNVTKPKSREGVGLWLIKIITGLLVVIVLSIHFIINHAVVPGGLLTYQDVLRYYTIWFIPVMEAIFLVVVVTHSLTGLRGIILDLNPSQKVSKWIDRVLLIVGAVAIIYGVWLLVVVTNKGLALL